MQFKRVDEQGRPVFNRVDESGAPVVADAPVAPPLEGQALAEARSKRKGSGTGFDPVAQIGKFIQRQKDEQKTLATRLFPEMALAAVTGGASLPIQMAAGAAIGGTEGGLPGAVIGAAIPAAAKGVGKLVGQFAADKELAAKLWNRVANVKAGRGGVQLDPKTGAFKTLPGRSMVDPKGGPVSEAMRAWMAKPDMKTQLNAHSELQKRGNQLAVELAKSQTPIDVAPLLPLKNNKVVSVLMSNKIKPTGLTRLSVNPTQAHKLQAEIGKRVNWNPNILNDSNEELKDAYFAIGKAIKTQIPTIKPFLKNWQESFLFNKALATTIEKAAAKPQLLSPTAKKLLAAGALGTAGVGGAKLAGILD